MPITPFVVVKDELLPPQFRQRAVDRYAPFISTVLKMWPGPVAFDPTPLSVETFSHRFRDACTAVISHNKTHELVKRDDLLRVYDRMITRVQNGQVVIADRQVSREEPLPVPITQSIQKVQGTLKWTDAPSLAAAALLLSNRVVTGPFRIEGTVDINVEQHLLSSFDIAFEKIDPTNTIML